MSSLTTMLSTISKLNRPGVHLSKLKLYRSISQNLSDNANAAVAATNKVEEMPANRISKVPLESRLEYQEFLPDPDLNFRNPIREKLERADMIKRRSAIDVPSFYVGSIVSVTSSDKHDVSKKRKFLGLCIAKRYAGLRHEFVLRNVIDNLGVEITYDLYDPTILNITVIRLEKRIDDDLFYLRDALPEYCTFPLDMEPEYLPEGEPIPVNDVKVQLRPRPWVRRWERKGYKGIANVDDYLTLKMKKQRASLETPWEKYDLMKEYRRTLPEEEQNEIFSEVYNELHQLNISKQKLKKKRVYVKPTKTA